VGLQGSLGAILAHYTVVPRDMQLPKVSALEMGLQGSLGAVLDHCNVRTTAKFALGWAIIN
jgi:hypothetical protein